MSLLESFLNGMVAGAGMFIASVVFGLLAFKVMKPWLTKAISEIWAEVKKSGLEVELKIDGKKKRHTK